MRSRAILSHDGGISGDDGVGRNTFGDNGARSNDGILADRNAFENVAFIPIQTLSAMMTGAVRSRGRGGRSLKNGASARASISRCAGSSG